MKGISKADRSLNLLGCSVEQLKQHLQETAIKNGYTDFDINNYDTSQFHIDHVIPCESFNLVNEDQQRRCFHYSNLQILTAKENLEKNKYEI